MTGVRVMVADGAYGSPARRLFECRDEDHQIAWAVAALQAGRQLHTELLWVGGVDRPMRVIAAARSELRRLGVALHRELGQFRDAAGDPVPTLIYRAQ